MLTVGIVGCGRARLAYGPALRGTEQVEVRALMDPDPAPARDWARELGGPPVYRTLDRILASDVDALLVLSPLADRAAQCLAGLRAGKHVLCRTPLSLDVRALDEALEAAAQSGLVLTPGLSRRSDAAIGRMCEEGSSASAGGPLRLRCEWSFPAPSGDTPHAWELSMAERTLGTVEVARFCLGPARSVSADLDLRPGRGRRAGLGNLIVTHLGGVSVHRLAWTSRGAAAERYTLEADDTELQVHSSGVPGWPWRSYRLTLRRPDGAADDVTPPESSAAQLAAGDLTRLAAAIGGAPEVDPGMVSQREALEDAAAAFLSSRDNVRVVLPLARVPSIAEVMGWELNP